MNVAWIFTITWSMPCSLVAFVLLLRFITGIYLWRYRIEAVGSFVIQPMLSPTMPRWWHADWEIVFSGGSHRTNPGVPLTWATPWASMLPDCKINSWLWVLATMSCLHTASLYRAYVHISL